LRNLFLADASEVLNKMIDENEAASSLLKRRESEQETNLSALQKQVFAAAEAVKVCTFSLLPIDNHSSLSDARFCLM
jgi:DNA repair exonuclease SbcCD ATPase subunit